MKVRNTNIELLRLFLFVSIFIWHVIMHGFKFTEIGLPNSEYWGNPYIDIPLASFLSPATYCFMFISGYYGMHYTHKKLGMIVFSAFSVFICMYIRNLIKYDMWGGEFLNIFPISTEVWWFLTGYVTILVLSPVVDTGIEYISKQNFQCVLIGFFSLVVLRIFRFDYSCGSTLSALLFVYLLGRYMNKYKVHLSTKISIIIFLLSFLCLVVVSLLFYMMGNSSNNKYVATFPFWFISSYNNPFTLAMSICLFYIAKNFPMYQNKLLNKMISSCLFIYLITEGFYTVYGRIAKIFVQNPFLSCFLSLFILAACLIFGHVSLKVYSYLYSMCGCFFKKHSDGISHK